MKQFACIWTGEYNDQVSIEKEHYFQEENGYDEEVLDRIKLADIGAVIIIEFKQHYIIRLKDIPDGNEGS